MEKSILKFHFDYLTISLSITSIIIKYSHEVNNSQHSQLWRQPSCQLFTIQQISMLFSLSFIFIIYGLKNIYGQSTNYEYTVLPLDWSTPGKDRTVGPTDDRLLQSQLLLMCNFPFYDAIMNSKLNFKKLTGRWETPTYLLF